VRLHLAQIAVITDVIAVSILIYIRIPLTQSRNTSGEFEGLKDRTRILFAASEVVDLGASGIEIELIHKGSDVFGMDIISDLFSLVAVDFVFPTFDVAFDQVTKKAV